MDASEIHSRYLADGHVVVPAVIDAAGVAELAALVEGFTPHTPANGVMPMNPMVEPARSMATDPRFVALAGAVLGAEPACFGASFVVKPARTGLPVLWHQDGYPWRDMWGIDPAVTLWVAIDEVSPDRGGLCVIPGSHRLGLHALVPVDELGEGAGADVFGWTSPPDVVEQALALGPVDDVVLRPGDVSIHHSALVHASGHNRSDHRRAALALRYCPAR